MDRGSRSRLRGRPERPRAGGDAGTGLVSLIAGFTVFLVFLLFAVNILVGLFTRSVVAGTAHDVARYFATPQGGAALDQDAPAARAEATRNIVTPQVGGLQPTWTVTMTGDFVEATVTVTHGTFLPAAFLPDWRSDTITRSARVRREQVDR
jgi:hypothetical protein